ncbi:MAG: hypothetical protein AB7F43_01310 [Bacteriovoracia bacterium]
MKVNLKVLVSVAVAGLLVGCGKASEPANPEQQAVAAPTGQTSQYPMYSNSYTYPTSTSATTAATGTTASTGVTAATGTTSYTVAATGTTTTTSTSSTTPQKSCITKAFRDSQTGLYGIKLKTSTAVAISCDSTEYRYVDLNSLYTTYGGAFGSSYMTCHSTRSKTGSSTGTYGQPTVQLVNNDRSVVKIDCDPLFKDLQYFYYKHAYYDGDMTLYGSIQCCNMQ